MQNEFILQDLFQIFILKCQYNFKSFDKLSSNFKLFPEDLASQTKESYPFLDVPLALYDYTFIS